MHPCMHAEGTKVKSSDLVAECGIIIFSYPKANTPGCTKQACGFRCAHVPAPA